MKNNNERGKINMKKMIAFLLAAVMLLSLTACGGGDKPANSESGTSTGETTDNSTEKDSAPQGAPAEIKPAEGGVLKIGIGNAAIVVNGTAVAMPCHTALGSWRLRVFPEMNPEKKSNWLRATSSLPTFFWMRMRIM